MTSVPGKPIKIALLGNPNSGKSTLFNILTGLNQKVANFPGVTVDKKTGITYLKDPLTSIQQEAEVLDLPGTYSLNPKSPDELIPFQVLCTSEPQNRPDVTVVIVDGSNLKRSLFLCTQVIDLGLPMVLALNMMDQVKARGLRINVDQLSEKLGVPVFPINARKKEGIEALKAGLLTVGKPTKSFVNLSELSSTPDETSIPFDYKTFLLSNQSFSAEPTKTTGHKEVKTEAQVLSSSLSKRLQAQETLLRYTEIGRMIDAVLSTTGTGRKSLTLLLDRLLTHRIWGFFFFALIMLLLFQAIFSWSSYPMALVESGFRWLSNEISLSLPDNVLRNLLVNGILAGLSGIIVFVPQIALLFLFISILEDTGYMARVSFIMDKAMRRFGLNGKSVIPLISGVACAVPAIMSTRTITNWKERIITIMVTPLMSCSARIPVYTLLISLVIPNHTVFGFLNLQGLMLMALYLLGFIAAILSALVLKLLVNSKGKSYFIMEMPVYRMPRWSNIAFTIVEKVKIFLFDAGKVIISISIILWLLSSYGPGHRMEDVEKKYGRAALLNAPTPIQQQENLHKAQSEKLSQSYAGLMGKHLETLIRPLGFDWKIGIALVTSFAAREVFVGTMATIYSVGDEANNQSSIREKMESDVDPETGAKVYTLATGVSLMIFYAFAMQCMSTVSVVYRETKRVKWPLIQIFYMSGLAYLSSLFIYNFLK